MTGQPDTLGIIAGNRSLPLAFAREARAAGVKRLVAVAFEGEKIGRASCRERVYVLV